MFPKTSKSLRIFMASLSVLVVALACGSTAPTTTISTPTVSVVVEQQPIEQLPTPTPASTIGKVGETVTQGAYSITLVGVEKATQYSEFFAPSAGNIFLSVEVIIQSSADTGVSVNPLYTSVRDSNGYEYTTSLLGKEPALQSQNDLPNGEFVRGWITFEVPESASGFIFTYEPLSFTDNIRIRFELGQ